MVSDEYPLMKFDPYSSPRFEVCPNISNKFCIYGQHDTKTILTSSDGHQFSTDTVPGGSDLSGDLRGEQRSTTIVETEVLISPCIWLPVVPAPIPSFYAHVPYLSFPSLGCVLLHEFRSRWSRLCHFRSRFETLRYLLTQGRVLRTTSCSLIPVSWKLTCD